MSSSPCEQKSKSKKKSWHSPAPNRQPIPALKNGSYVNVKIFNNMTSFTVIGAKGRVSFGSAVSGQAAFTGTAPNLVPNSSYYSDATFGRDTYLVVEYARITPSDAKYDASLANLVNPGVNNSLTSFGSLSSSVGAVKKKFGFLAPSTTNIQRAYATL